jgi:hypothetical protein
MLVPKGLEVICKQKVDNAELHTSCTLHNATQRCKGREVQKNATAEYEAQRRNKKDIFQSQCVLGGGS